jgi:hypothetical protein
VRGDASRDTSKASNVTLDWKTGRLPCQSHYSTTAFHPALEKYAGVKQGFRPNPWAYRPKCVPVNDGPFLLVNSWVETVAKSLVKVEVDDVAIEQCKE